MEPLRRIWATAPRPSPPPPHPHPFREPPVGWETEHMGTGLPACPRRCGPDPGPGTPACGGRQRAGAPGFTFAPRLVLVREVLRAGACHQLHVGGTVYLGSRGDTAGAEGSEPVPHTQPHQCRTHVLLSAGTDGLSPPTTEEVAALNRGDSVVRGKHSSCHLGNRGQGPCWGDP